MKTFFIFFIFLAACSNKSIQRPKVPIWLSLNSQLKAVTSLPVSVEKIQFINNNRPFTIDLSQKKLDLGFDGNQFIDGLLVPIGDYQKIRVVFKLAPSGLQLLNAAQLNTLQMLDHDQLFVPQTRDRFIIEQSVDLSITENQRHFLKLTVLNSTLTLANTDTSENYLLFDPQIVITQPESQQVIAMVTEKSMDQVFFKAGQAELIKSISVGQSTVEVGDTVLLKVNQDSITVPSLPMPHITGLVASNGDSAWLYKVNKTGTHFLGQKKLDNQQHFIAGQRILLPIAALTDTVLAGNDFDTQSLPLKEKNLEASSLLIAASELIVGVNEQGWLPLSLNQYPFDVFYQDKLTVSVDWPSTNDNTFWQLHGYFIEQNDEPVFFAVSMSPMDISPVTLSMNFHVFNETMMLYDTLDNQNTRLLFLEGLESVTQSVRINNLPMEVIGSLDDMIISSNTSLQLNIIEGDIQQHSTAESIDTFLMQIDNKLKTHKFFRIEAVGKGSA